MYVFHFSHYPRETTPTAGNIFDALSPLAFCTPDHDTNQCAKAAPGWYGSDCNGYSLFADDVLFPINGTDQIANSGKFNFERANSEFYVDQ